MISSTFISPGSSASGAVLACPADGGSPRESLGCRLVYAMISPRAHGLALTINMNPDKHCNFDCAYCEVNRSPASLPVPLEVDLLAGELEHMLELAASGGLQNVYACRHLPRDLLRLRQVALSGDGEPTLCPNFLDAVQTVMHTRALGKFPFFPVVLITNGAGLDLRPVQEGLKLFTTRDEVWVKLEAGSQAYMDQVNRPGCSLDRILANILMLARQRPVVIQSLFPLLDQREPPADEIEQYAQRLDDLRRAGAQIALVQVYSVTRSPARPGCRHLPLGSLMRIARRVREVSGLKAEVF